MKPRPQGSKAGTKTTRGRKAIKNRARLAKTAKLVRQGTDLEKTLALIRAHPGIRPSEINRLLNREESDGLRGTLIKHGLIRKEKDGSATRYYPA
jgi:predicted transcriptional regulator